MTPSQFGNNANASPTPFELTAERLLRLALVLLFLSFGAHKFTDYEAEGIAPFVIVREVMTSQGGGATVIYDMAPGQPESKRVLRLENVNGMQEVIYDDAMPSTMALGSGSAPRLVHGGGGMYRVEYDPR